MPKFNRSLNGLAYSRCYIGGVPKPMIHEILPVGLLQCNCTILGDPDTLEALVLDPGDETSRILESSRGIPYASARL